MWLSEFLTNIYSSGITWWLQPYGYVGAGRSLSDWHKAVKGGTDFAQGPAAVWSLFLHPSQMRGTRCEGLILPSDGFIQNWPQQPRNTDPSCTEISFLFGIFSHKALLFYAAQLCTQMPSVYNFQWKVNEMASLLSCQKYNWNANLKTFSKIAPFCTKILINQKHFCLKQACFHCLENSKKSSPNFFNQLF